VYVALHTEGDGARDLPVFRDAFVRANYTTMSATQNGKWYSFSLPSPSTPVTGTDEVFNQIITQFLIQGINMTLLI
jgi:hypothetical protein